MPQFHKLIRVTNYSDIYLMYNCLTKDITPTRYSEIYFCTQTCLAPHFKLTFRTNVLFII